MNYFKNNSWRLIFSFRCYIWSTFPYCENVFSRNCPLSIRIIPFREQPYKFGWLKKSSICISFKAFFILYYISLKGSSYFCIATSRSETFFSYLNAMWISWENKNVPTNFNKFVTRHSPTRPLRKMVASVPKPWSLPSNITRVSKVSDHFSN